MLSFLRTPGYGNVSGKTGSASKTSENPKHCLAYYSVATDQTVCNQGENMLSSSREKFEYVADKPGNPWAVDAWN